MSSTNLGGSNRMLTTDEAAAYLALPDGRALRDNWVRWQIPAHKYGRTLKFRVRDLDAFIDRRAVSP
jgi:excisionase family DNA binding protein